MEVAAFHPHPLDRMRLVSVALFLAFTIARAKAYSVWALPSIPLFGARTFLSRRRKIAPSAATAWPTSSAYVSTVTVGPCAGAVSRQRIVCPALSGTTACEPNAYSAGTVHASRVSVTVSPLRGSP